MIIWLTGQPGHGKTTIARALREHGVVDWVIDGDELRAIREESYDYYGRHRNVERAQSIAAYLSNEGERVAVALVSPRRAQRNAFGAECDVLEVYLHTEEVRGREHFHVHDYEPPANGLSLDTSKTSVSECVRAILEALAL